MSYVMTNANVFCIDAKTIIIAWPYDDAESYNVPKSAQQISTHLHSYMEHRR